MPFSIFAQKIGNWFQWTNKYFLWCKIWKSSLTVPLGHLLWLVWGRKKFHKELFHHRFIKNFFTTPGFFIAVLPQSIFSRGEAIRWLFGCFLLAVSVYSWKRGIVSETKTDRSESQSKLMNWRQTLLEIIWQATHGDYTKLKYKNWKFRHSTKRQG